MVDQVSCTFFNPKTKLIERQDIKVDTSLGAKMVVIRDACERYARAVAAPYFAMPTCVDRGAGERWFVFEMGPKNWPPIERKAILKRDWPTRDSAEMWVQHNG